MGALTFPPPTPALVLFGRDHAGKPHASWFDAPSAELATKAAGLMSMRAVAVETDELRELATSLPRGRLFSSGRAFTPFVKGKLYERLVELTRDVLSSEAPAAANGDEPAAEPDTAAAEPMQAVDAAEGGAMLDAAAAPPAEEAAATADEPVHGPDPVTATASATAAEPVAEITTAAKPAAPVAAKPSPRPSRLEEIGPGSLVLATTGAGEGWYEARVIGVNGSTFTLKYADYNEPSILRRGNELGFLPRLPA